jgi:phage-related minor tail protein
MLGEIRAFLYLFGERRTLMANRIKGITVEIGGDTTGLDKSLNGINSSSTKTQSALNDVNRLLKLDPSNTVLVAAAFARGDS